MNAECIMHAECKDDYDYDYDSNGSLHPAVLSARAFGPTEQASERIPRLCVTQPLSQEICLSVRSWPLTPRMTI